MVAVTLLAPVLLPARNADAPDFASHLVRHLAESGRDGTPDFASMRVAARSDIMRETERKWSTQLLAPGWGRTWLLWTRDPTSRSHDAAAVVGYVELRGPFVASAGHRAELSIGLEAPYRGRGHGRALLDTAIAWARSTQYLAYIDLRVFAGNARARAMYAAAGFVELGYVPDAFRFEEGVTIDDVLMTLRLR